MNYENLLTFDHLMSIRDFRLVQPRDGFDGADIGAVIAEYDDTIIILSGDRVEHYIIGAGGETQHVYVYKLISNNLYFKYEQKCV